MGRVGKLLGGIVALVILVGVFVVQDWYRFTKYGEIDAKRGVYGNDHLEVWIDINAKMPAPMRKWACKTLLEREEKVIGGVGRAPYGCDPDFDPDAVGQTMSAAVIGANMNSAAIMAQSSNATPEQINAVSACMQTSFANKVTPAQIEALDAGSPDAETMTTVNKMGVSATAECLKSAGL
jgi:hypothetical protein